MTQSTTSWSAALLVFALGCGGEREEVTEVTVEETTGAELPKPATGPEAPAPTGPGMQQGMGPGMQQEMGPGMQQGMGPGMQQGMGPGMQQGMGRGMGMAACPVAVPGTTVSMTEIEGGGALTFETQADVEDLRARTRLLAEHYTRMHEEGAVPPGRGMRRGPGAQGVPAPPPSTATVVDVDRGARVELRALDPDDTEALRDHLTARARQYQAGQCPMMETQGTISE